MSGSAPGREPAPSGDRIRDRNVDRESWSIWVSEDVSSRGTQELEDAAVALRE
jgi:hypothetical protein